MSTLIAIAIVSAAATTVVAWWCDRSFRRRTARPPSTPYSWGLPAEDDETEEELYALLCQAGADVTPEEIAGWSGEDYAAAWRYVRELAEPDAAATTTIPRILRSRKWRMMP
jgi:hypothetical protein